MIELIETVGISAAVAGGMAVAIDSVKYIAKKELKKSFRRKGNDYK